MRPRLLAVVVLASATLSPLVVGLAGANSYSENPGWPHRKHFSTKLKPYTPKKYKDLGLADKLTATGHSTKGVWLTPSWVWKVSPKKTVRILKRAHLNAVVIDVKDDFGNVTYPSKIPLAKKVRRHIIRDPKKMLATYHKAGIYVIARITAFKDSKLPLVRPDLSMRIGRKARRLFSAGAGWLDHYSDEVWDYLIDIGREVADLGFDEVQFDYIRFPKGYAGTLGKWLHKKDDEKRPRWQLIADFLQRADRAIKVPISVDVFGLTTLVDGDPRRLGQYLEKLAPYVEAISPMMYASGMTTYFRHNKVTAPRIYSMIHCGLWRARKKLKNTVLRPYLQAYPNNVSFYGGRFIADQVRAAWRAGSDGFLFWAPPMHFSAPIRGMRMVGKKLLDAYDKDAHTRYLAKKNHPVRWCRLKGAVFGTPKHAHRKHRRHHRRRGTRTAARSK